MLSPIAPKLLSINTEQYYTSGRSPPYISKGSRSSGSIAPNTMYISSVIVNDADRSPYSILVG